MNKKISVVILNWNGASLLEQFLPSVIRYSPETVADVIVADNGSTDTSLQLLAQEFPQVGLIRFPRNHVESLRSCGKSDGRRSAFRCHAGGKETVFE